MRMKIDARDRGALSRAGCTALCVAASLALQACATAKMVKGAGSEVQQGNIGTALYLGTMGVAMGAIYDVFTFGGLLAPDKTEPSSSTGSTTTYPAATPAKTDLEVAQGDLERAERDLSLNQNAQLLLAALGKDTSQLALQEQLLQQSVDKAQAKVDSLSAGSTLSSSSTSSDSAGASQVALESDSGSGHAGGACKTTLAHLAPSLPQYDVAEIQETRTAIVSEDLRVAARKAKSMGLSTADAASQSLQAANNADQQVKVAAECIRNFATSPEQVIRSLEQGTFQFGGGSIGQLNINESCAAQYVVLKYAAIATRESAVQMACLARSNH
ncbi:hypothetical protein ACPOLB_03860 [Rubrivivax sp. RP6-9]|uniref:hypothetical protein n=1 Tax=Rubrivivax sp. RP6-9 TaxID=3415750 RepID=UPI003CC65436